MVLYVADASRSVSVASALLSEQNKQRFVDDVQLEYDKIRERHAKRQNKVELISYEDAIDNLSNGASDGGIAGAAEGRIVLDAAAAPSVRASTSPHQAESPRPTGCHRRSRSRPGSPGC